MALFLALYSDYMTKKFNDEIKKVAVVQYELYYCAIKYYYEYDCCSLQLSFEKDDNGSVLIGQTQTCSRTTSLIVFLCLVDSSFIWNPCEQKNDSQTQSTFSKDPVCANKPV